MNIHIGLTYINIAWFIMIQKVEFKSKIFFSFIHHKKNNNKQIKQHKQKINKNLKINKAPQLMVHFCLMSNI